MTQAPAPTKGTFATIAEPMIAYGIPVTPIQRGSKRAFLSGWDDSATISSAVVTTWDEQYPGHNCQSILATVGRINST